MAKVNWTFEAYGDLSDINDFLEKGSPKFAEFIVDSILEKTRNLASFPKIGRKVPEADLENLREILIENYRVVYFLRSDDVVEILTVRHSSKPLPKF